MELRVALAWLVRVTAALLGVLLVLLGAQAFLFMGIVGLFAGLPGVVPALTGMGIGLAVAVCGGWLVYGGVRNFPLVRSLTAL